MTDRPSVQDPGDLIGLPERPVDPDWLALREPADARARDGSASAVVTPLLQWLGSQLNPTSSLGSSAVSGPGPGLRVVDLGAGTGANLRWLAPRLAGLGGAAALDRQRWTLVDHDPRLRSWGPAGSVTVRADVAALDAVLTSLGGADLVTAAALLDLLDTPQLEAVVSAVVAHGVPALFSLSVTGEVTLDPQDPLDAPLAEAFDAHQRRDGRLGPDAGAAAARLFRAHGWTVVAAPAPWTFLPDEAVLISAWLEGRAEAAVEWQPGLAGPAAAWLRRRRDELASGGLTATAGHLDVLAVPAATAMTAGR